MKPIFFVIVFLFASIVSFAQTEKGNFLIGGTVGLGNSNMDVNYNGTLSSYKTKTFSLSLSPNVSYFIIDHLAVWYTRELFLF
ncbi:MAG: hypothetical protein QM734_14575 [Cyclobacteriaceae bacterium]